ncbi:MAG: DUF222 domain-containing protein [Ilumatobacteraceae bacterium]
MDTALHLLRQGLEALRAVDTGLLATTELGTGLLHLQKLLDGLNVEHAKLMNEADRAGVHAGTGHRNIASWLAANGKTSYQRAKKQQDLGDAMNNSPELADAVANGELSPDTASELLPTLGSDHSGDIAELIGVCKGASPTEAKAAGEKFQELNKPAGESDREREAKKRAKRSLRFNDLGDGMTSLAGMLPTTDARTVKDSLDAIIRNWNDFQDPRTLEQEHADAIVELCHAFNAGEVTGGREAPTVMIRIDIEDLEGSGVGYNTHGELVPAEIVRRMCTNANLVRVISNGSDVLDLGRRARFASDAQFRAIIARDGSFCRIPGCCMPAKWCEVDHVREWERQGNTDLDSLILLCSYHHHMRHLPGVTLHGDANNLEITLANGHRIPMPPKWAGTPASTTTATATAAAPATTAPANTAPTSGAPPGHRTAA